MLQIISSDLEEIKACRLCRQFGYDGLSEARDSVVTVTESKSLKKGTRVYWRGDAAEGGVIAETSWDAVTITWDNGRVGRVHHGNMREIDREPRPSRARSRS